LTFSEEIKKIKNDGRKEMMANVMQIHAFQDNKEVPAEKTLIVNDEDWVDRRRQRKQIRTKM